MAVGSDDFLHGIDVILSPHLKSATRQAAAKNPAREQNPADDPGEKQPSQNESSDLAGASMPVMQRHSQLRKCIVVHTLNNA
jgi:hypothetical protein